MLASDDTSIMERSNWIKGTHSDKQDASGERIRRDDVGKEQTEENREEATWKCKRE